MFYLDRNLKVCFVEAVLRDARDAVVGELIVDETEFTSRRFAEIEVASALTLIDVREDARIRQGVPSEVVGGKRHGLARQWSVAFHEHPGKIDGAIYPFRLTGIDNIVLYDRAVPKLRVRKVYALDAAPGLWEVMGIYKIAFAPV